MAGSERLEGENEENGRTFQKLERVFLQKNRHEDALFCTQKYTFQRQHGTESAHEPHSRACAARGKLPNQPERAETCRTDPHTLVEMLGWSREAIKCDKSCIQHELCAAI